MPPIQQSSLALHKKLHGKIEIALKAKVKNRRDLSLVYTPGVGAVSLAIAKNPKLADTMTWKKNTVAIVSDGSAVLGLGNIGPLGALPVMEGKSVIFKQFANIDAVPIVLSTQDSDEIVAAVKAIAPTFGAIQLEDISAPRCFGIENRLMDELDMPVMHDDQHGTAIVVLAGLMNALKVVKKSLTDIRIVLSGAGAAGTAIAKLLIASGASDLVVCDSKGIIGMNRKDLNAEKKALRSVTNPRGLNGYLKEALTGADVFIGISAPGILTKELVKTMAKKPVVFALANPTPEILPKDAKKAGVAVIATGRSDFANQVNNALCYPGLFRGMLDNNIKRVDDAIKIRAAKAIAAFIKHPTPDRIIPTMFDKGLHEAVARSVRNR
ncbi:MAG: NADP-dependent malic enzyme [Patescibacteria group bacterium]